VISGYDKSWISMPL